MNVRVFVLLAMTALFGVLWSSDRQYQEAQIVAAQSARRQTVVRVAVSAPRPIFTSTISSGDTDLSSDSANSVVRVLFGPVVQRCVGVSVEWGDRLHSRIDEDSCMLRWHTRKALFFAQRRAAMLFRQQMTWREIAIRLGRDAWRRIETSKSAAAPGTVETR